MMRTPHPSDAIRETMKALARIRAKLASAAELVASIEPPITNEAPAYWRAMTKGEPPAASPSRRAWEGMTAGVAAAMKRATVYEREVLEALQAHLQAQAEGEEKAEDSAADSEGGPIV